ncbi:hypothetical protein GCM10009655_15430 [Rhodoglobus aureus]|uniref:DUF3039 domain-containing protein n=1 Tax=Rhodoglobus aureus TaxID=191497 RepID=A0ABP4GAS0_9MICO
MDVDLRIARLDAWKAQLHLSVLVLLANCLDEEAAGPLIVLSPKPNTATETEPLAEVSLTTTTVEEEGEVVRELIVEIVPLKHTKLTERAIATTLAAIEPDTHSWTTAPLNASAMSHSVLTTEEMYQRAFNARESGSSDPHELPGVLRVGTIAHYTAATSVTQATIEGAAVEAMCGHWFVPMHDHDQLDICGGCSDARNRLPEE